MQSRKNFYKAFEDKYRGSRDVIKSRLKVYLPFVERLHALGSFQAIDLGCGRGEWLELLQEMKCSAIGIDLDEGMLEDCKLKKLNVKHQDVLEALVNLEDDSMSIVSGFHIVEHLTFDELQKIVTESLRVLIPGGLLILETPNPENIRVGTEYFYDDATHIRPIPANLLSFIPEHYGFERVKVLKLQEPQALHTKDHVTLSDVFWGVSPDYCVIAQKKATSEVLEKFDDLFFKTYGITLDDILNKFENRLSYYEEKVKQLEQSNQEAWKHYFLMTNSVSWKITRPLRLLKKVLFMKK